MSDEQTPNEQPRKPSGVKPAGPPKGVKPAGPLKAAKPAGPPDPDAVTPGARSADPPGLQGVRAGGPRTSKPAGPPKAARPAGPPSAKPAGPTPAGTKPARPPARPGTRPGKPPASRVVGVPAEGPPSGDGDLGALPVLSRQDFVSGSDVRWCPGCGDYAVLAAVQRVLPELTEKKEDVVFISGIGCSSRFPYYVDTYGFHTIHGRAPAVATGLKASRPALDVWIITGDGDALSIGGNHLLHLLRRNLDCQLILFNNQIYGLTKGQYSPTSEQGKVTGSTPYGSLDHPFNPAAVALGADASFVARSLDRDPKHMQEVFRRAHAHRGAAFVEVYQNCNIFNDGAFFDFTEKGSKPERTVFVEHGQPLVYADGRKGLALDGRRFVALDLGGDRTADDCLVWDETDRGLSHLLTQQLFRDADLPRPFGVFYVEERPTYDRQLQEQVEAVTAKKGPGDLEKLLRAGATWTIE